MTQENPKIVFFGTPEICIPILEALNECNMAPLAIVTMPDRPVGRRQILTPPPVKVWGEQKNIPILQPEKLTAEFEKSLSGTNPDIFLVVAYGKIMPATLLNIPRYGSLNIHYSLLPTLRGASPVQSAILQNLPETGVTIQKMVYELDAGPILSQQKIRLPENAFATDILDKLNIIASDMICDTVRKYISGEIKPRPQIGEPTFCRKIKKSDGLITKTATDEEAWRKYRALTPWPSIYIVNTDGKRVKINTAEFSEGKFIATSFTVEGSKPRSERKSLNELFSL